MLSALLENVELMISKVTPEGKDLIDLLLQLPSVVEVILPSRIQTVLMPESVIASYRD